MIIVDVGSTTTKALLFAKQDGVWNYIERGEAATTVEAPFEDVMVGLRQALKLLEERSGFVLSNDTNFSEADRVLQSDEEFLVTCSAGGGLQMVVCGNASRLTGESAQRAAMGGGAILLDVFVADDGRQHSHNLELLRNLRPDMILLCGGVEGTRNIGFIIEMCDFLRTAKPRPKFDYQQPLPLVYAGASDLAPVVEDLLGEDFLLRVVDNLRPTFDKENLEPAREAIHELFIEHVMSSAPGYSHLQAKATQPLLPTPRAVGEIITRYARHRGANILCLDIGGATTDIFSVVAGRYVRTVSANYGMSYSIGNVVTKAGLPNIMRWLPSFISEKQVKLSVGAKMLNPTSIPSAVEDLHIEQAVAREALRLAFLDHLELSKIQAPKSVFTSELLQKARRLNIEEVDAIIGSGGVLSHAPHRGQAAAMLIDAFQPLGSTELLVDSVFMLPHLGAFGLLDEANALRVLEKDCLIPLGTVLAPAGKARSGKLALRLTGITSTGERLYAEANSGDFLCLPLPPHETAEVEVTVHSGASWPWKPRFTVRGGLCGLIIDLRGRPLPLGAENAYNPAWVEELCQGGE